jgi:hypothetical protein
MEEVTLVHEGIRMSLVPKGVQRSVLAQKLTDMVNRSDDGFEKAVRIVRQLSMSVEGRKLLSEAAAWASKHQLRPKMARAQKVNPINSVEGPLILNRGKFNAAGAPASPKIRSWVARNFVR